MVSSHYPSYCAETLRRLGELAHTSCVEVGKELAGELAKGNGKHKALGGDSGVAFGGDIALLSDYRDLEALIVTDRPDVSPLARAIACLCALSRLETAQMSGPEVETLFGKSSVASAVMTHDQVQRQLSRLLVDFPVLLDPRIRVRTTLAGNYKVSSTIASQIALLDKVALPRLAHGISEEELRRFASHPCVYDGLRAKGTFTSDATPMLLAVDPSHCSETPGLVRGAFVASMVELDRYCRETTGQHLLREATQIQGNRRLSTSHLLQAVCHAFWDTVAGGTRCGLARHELVALMRTPTAPLDLRCEDETLRPLGHPAAPGGPLDGLLSQYLRATMSYGLFSLPGNKAGAKVSPWFDCAPADGATVTARVHGTVDLMVECGLATSQSAAALALARLALADTADVGPPTIDAMTAVVDCAPEVAAAFLRAVAVHGVRVAVGPLESPYGTPAAPHVRNVWHPIAKALALELQMMDVIDARPAAAAAPAAPSTSSAPSALPRRQRVAV